MAKRRNRAIRKAEARTQKKDPGYKYQGQMFVNDHGLRITKDEHDRMQKAIKTVLDKRKEMRTLLDPLPHKIEGELVGDTVGNMRHSMGRELDFILSHNFKNWNEFDNKAAFDRHLARMEYRADPEYINKRIRQYKQNFTKSLLETYGSQARDIAMRIRMMPPEQYMKMVEQDEALEIGYYGDSDQYIPGMLNKIRRALGMVEKDEDTLAMEIGMMNNRRVAMRPFVDY